MTIKQLSDLEILEVEKQVNREEHTQREFPKWIETQNIEKPITTELINALLSIPEDRTNLDSRKWNLEWTEDNITIPKESRVRKSQVRFQQRRRQRTTSPNWTSLSIQEHWYPSKKCKTFTGNEVRRTNKETATTNETTEEDEISKKKRRQRDKSDNTTGRNKSKDIDERGTQKIPRLGQVTRKTKSKSGPS